MHPRHAPGPGYPAGCHWPACGITCAAPLLVPSSLCHRACERRTPHSDTALSSQRKSIGYAGRGGPQGQTEAGIRSGAALATGRAIGERTAWYRCVGGLPPPPKAVPSQGLSKVQPSSPEVLTTDGRRIWGTRGEAVSDGAVEVCYGRYAERGGCAGQAAIAIAEKTGCARRSSKKITCGRTRTSSRDVFSLLQCAHMRGPY